MSVAAQYHRSDIVKSALHLTAPAIALALLAAHFLRGSALAPSAAALLALALLFVPRPWAARAAQAALALGVVEWLRTLGALVAQRIASGEPWLRLAAILGGVALLTALSLVVFRAAAVRAHFGHRTATKPRGS